MWLKKGYLSELLFEKTLIEVNNEIGGTYSCSSKTICADDCYD